MERLVDGFDNIGMDRLYLYNLNGDNFQYLNVSYDVPYYIYIISYIVSLLTLSLAMFINIIHSSQY